MTADAVGGVWTFAVDLGRELVTRGVRTTLAVMGPSPSDAQRADAWAAGISVVDRPYRLEWMDEPWDDVDRAGEWLLDLERRLGPSLVHLNGYAHASLPWHAPVMVVAHSCVRSWWRAVRNETPPPAVDRYTAAVTTALSHAQMVVAPTVAMGRALCTEYPLPISPRTIPNGLPARAGVGTVDAEREPFVLASGRLWDEAKNVAAICDVAARLAWPVFVAGERCDPGGRGPELAGVHLLGQLPPAEMRRWFRRASIYALPARYEPFGLTVLEAAARDARWYSAISPRCARTGTAPPSSSIPTTATRCITRFSGSSRGRQNASISRAAPEPGRAHHRPDGGCVSGVLRAVMKPSVAFFGSSLVSAYWNGAATYYRGIIRALAARGFDVTFYEPDAYDRQAHRDIPDPP